MDNETRKAGRSTDKSPTTSVRFAPEDKAIIIQAARLEGMEATAYIRRVAILYTREHHPELFKD
jgi:uncharacterized protein (DUF1778 family)